jgi:hypothetical protein
MKFIIFSLILLSSCSNEQVSKRQTDHFQNTLRNGQNLELRYYYTSDNNYSQFKSVKLNKSAQKQLAESIEIVDQYDEDSYIITSIPDHSIYFEKGINSMEINVKGLEYLSSGLLSTDYKLTSNSVNLLKRLFYTHNPLNLSKSSNQAIKQMRESTNVE